jgi:hypothetical protein
LYVKVGAKQPTQLLWVRKRFRLRVRISSRRKNWVGGED